MLTSKLAKPAVAYGGKYRIIDFPLSNCVNSGIEAVGVLTQYQPLRAQRVYRKRTALGSGQHEQRAYRCCRPISAAGEADWYKGTANAIYQNMNYIDRYDPDYVVVLSGDHIYKMDYSKMVAYHKEKEADVHYRRNRRALWRRLPASAF